jgi:hypothetical protein
MPELLERTDLPEVELPPPDEALVVRGGRAAAEGEARPDWFVPEGLDTALYEHDEHASRADLRRQIAALELELGRLFGSAFPRQGIDFTVPGLGGPRLLSVDELERVRDGLAARVEDVRLRLNDVGYVEQKNRELIEAMFADPASHKWVRVYNADIGEPGCKNWHAKPKWGAVGLLMGWWRVKISSGCPLAEGLRPPDQLMATKRQRRKRRRGHTTERGRSAGSPRPRASATRAGGQGTRSARPGSETLSARRGPADRPKALWGDFPLSELVVLVALILLVVGFITGAAVTLGVGLGLGALAGVELAAREHFTGYRSHNVVLAGAAGMSVFGLLFVLTPVSPAICVAAGAIVFGGSAWLLVSAFRRRSGGAFYRIKP